MAHPGRQSASQAAQGGCGPHQREGDGMKRAIGLVIVVALAKLHAIVLADKLRSRALLWQMMGDVEALGFVWAVRSNWPNRDEMIARQWKRKQWFHRRAVRNWQRAALLLHGRNAPA